jgi:hypothetical protein
MHLKTFQFQPITEKISFNYSIPKNKQELMYDFYLLTSLPLWGLGGVKGTKAPVAEGPAMEMLAKDAQKKLVKYLKVDLLKAVKYSLASEIRHALAFASAKDLEKVFGKQNLYKYLKNLGLISDWDGMMAEIKEGKYSTYFESWMKDDGDDFFFEDSGRDLSYKAISKTFTNRQFAELAKKVFMSPIWKEVPSKDSARLAWSKYGGPAWAKIAEGWLKLDSASSYEDMVVYIDHIFDLQHNTDSVLNKVKSYADTDGFHRWIGQALETKKHAQSPFTLIQYASPTLKSFAARVTKAATGETLDKWYKKYKSLPAMWEWR